MGGAWWTGLPNHSNVIALHLDSEGLKVEVEKLRTELSVLVLERDDLLHQECKNIEMAYMLSVGWLEYKAYEIECEILRLKRKSELIQAKKNRQEAIVLSTIESILDSEFAEYKAKLDEQIRKMNSALQRSRGKLLTAEESRELKNLYRAIVKALHPDLHPELSDAKMQLFRNALDAYEHGDLNGLRIIDAMVSGLAVTAEKPQRLAFLVKEKERLTNLIRIVRDEIIEIKSEFPYTAKSFVQDPEKIEARKSELEERIRQLKEVFAAYAARIEEMLR